MKGYHFVGDTLRDGNPVPADGVWLEHKGPVVCCFSGYHMSEQPADALTHAPGPTICLVDLVGDLQSDGVPIHKWVGRRRQIIKRMDATPMIGEYAVAQVLSLRHVVEIPTIIREYLLVPVPHAASAAYALAQFIAWPVVRQVAKNDTRAAYRAFGRASAWAISLLSDRSIVSDGGSSPNDVVIKHRVVQYEVGSVVDLLAHASVEVEKVPGIKSIEQGDLEKTLGELDIARESFNQQIARAFDREEK